MGLGKLKAAMFITFVILFGIVLALSGILVWIVAPGLYAKSVYALLTFLLTLTVGFTLLQWAIAPYIIRAFTNMKELDKRDYPWLHEMLDELAKKAKLKNKPRLYIVHDGTPNAFAFGWMRSKSFIAVHTGLLEALNKDEIKSVLAHEVGHVKHNDIVLITVASMIPVFVYYLIIAIGSIVARSRDDDNGLAFIFIWIGAFIAQFFTYLLVLYLSRVREFYADAFAGAATSPKHMRTGLAKIAYGFPQLSAGRTKKYGTKRAFYIADPFTAEAIANRDKQLKKDMEESVKKREKEGRHLDAGKELEDAMDWERTHMAAKFTQIFSTHPLTYRRIDALFELE
ncbi:MAG: M48 family metalloprotease, partial [Candidatus Aenigmarchaeota archaeon]|nr:M48 family metalloprotease [Candidatus Aenigmarchaeota archaeon]MDI6722735.1 M48 family metalloprotease [Candidatus Aenigmarchaeota archaeon]